MFLNYSRATRFHDCKRRFFFSELFDGTGLAPDKEDVRLVVGISVHVGLAALLKGMDPESAAQLARDTYLSIRAKWNTFILDEWKEEAEYCATIVREYSKEPMQDYEILDIESSFCVPLGEVCWNCGEKYDNPGQQCPGCKAEVHYWVGTRDLLVRRMGHLAIQDHKTTAATPDDGFLEKFRNSFQLIGYVYGSEKDVGAPIREYGVNALQKAKTLGTEQSVWKRCPDCRNGKRKVLTCQTCEQTGKVEKKVKLEPFRHKWFTIDDSDVDRFVLWAHKTIMDIEREKRLMKDEPEIAFEMNSKSCNFGPCPFIPLCWRQRNAMKWYEPSREQMDEAEVHPRPADYVQSFEQAAKEEEV